MVLKKEIVSYVIKNVANVMVLMKISVNGVQIITFSKNLRNVKNHVIQNFTRIKKKINVQTVIQIV